MATAEIESEVTNTAEPVEAATTTEATKEQPPVKPDSAKLAEIKTANADATKRKAEYDDLKEDCKHAKARWEAAVDRLTSIIDQELEYLPLFDGKAKAETDPEAWRLAAIDELGLPPRVAEKLIENDIDTVGQLEDLRASQDGLKSVPGIGQAKADQIEEAVLKWLSENRDGFGEVAKATDSLDEALGGQEG